jgi:hypothetical protein
MEHCITPGDAGCGQTWVKPLGRLAAWWALANRGVADGPEVTWDVAAAAGTVSADTVARPATVRLAAAASAPAHRGNTTTGMNPPEGAQARP